MSSPLANGLPTSSANDLPSNNNDNDNNDPTRARMIPNGDGRGGGGEPSSSAGGARGAAGRGGGARARRRARNPNWRDEGEVPRVRDETGEKVRESFEAFLENFSENETYPLPPPSSSSAPSSDMDEDEDDEDDFGTGRSERRRRRNNNKPHRLYLEQVKGMQEFKLTTVFVDFGHLLEAEEVLGRAISDQYYRFLPHLLLGLRNLVARYLPSYLYLNSTTSVTPSATNSSNTNTTSTNSGLQYRQFQIAFYNLPLTLSIRDLKTEKIGKLVSVSGTVTRTSEVRPELIKGVFMCEECKTVVREVEQQFKYTEPSVCPNMQCSNRNTWKLIISQCHFDDWQKVRIQENSNEIPTGSMPRSLDVVLRGSAVEHAKAGDKCVFTGCFVVVPDVAALGLPGMNTEMLKEANGGRGGGVGGLGAMGVGGLKALGVRDLTYKTAFLACMVQSADSRSTSTNVRADPDEGAEESDRKEYLESLTKEEVQELQAMVNSPYIYSKLVRSIAPTVYGHEIVKKGILLQLMGGVHKETKEGIGLRGDINICIVGDPSTSKSQFLKYVCGFLPRSVYTSGKASSAAGLTAAVVKDEETGEFTIEAGALMLADNGICAIDEFDKMDISDQVAIHEAMEQQTISIAKAGIQATLNARTSILAAANPVGGRYNRKISLRQNVMMSAPIMSRFDLFFVVLDECNEEVDKSIAEHIVNVHRYQDAAINPEFTTDVLQRYIRLARTFNPKLSSEASHTLVEKYRSLRQDDSTGFGRNSYRITVRQLESMIRLSEAIARASCKTTITPSHVREAYSLLRQSIIHVEKDDIEMEDEEDDEAAAINGGAGGGGGDDDDDDGGGGGEDGDVPVSSQPITSPTRGGQERRDPTPGPSGTGGSGAQADAATAKKKNKTVITYDKYTAIMNLIVWRLGEHEKETGQGLERSKAVEWYLEQKESEINTMEELEQETSLIEKVLTKLIKEKYLLEIRGEVEMEVDASEEAETSAAGAKKAKSPILLVHPDVDYQT